jgi:hypothetical protein
MNFKQAAILTVSFCLVAVALTVSAQGEDKLTKSFGGWMSVTDPDKDCEFRLLGNKLTVTVPETNHNLHPVRGLNAPRVLKKVNGDFTVQVKVTADFKPGKESTKVPQQGRPFNGAGILIWQSEENYLRIERNAYWVDDSLYCYPPLIEYWHNRENSGFNNDPTDKPYFTGRSTWLKALRKGRDVKTFPVEMADAVSVGVAAINSSNLPFTVEFDEFSIESE